MPLRVESSNTAFSVFRIDRTERISLSGEIPLLSVAASGAKGDGPAARPFHLGPSRWSDRAPTVSPDGSLSRWVRSLVRLRPLLQFRERPLRCLVRMAHVATIRGTVLDGVGR